MAFLSVAAARQHQMGEIKECRRVDQRLEPTTTYVLQQVLAIGNRSAAKRRLWRNHGVWILKTTTPLSRNFIARADDTRGWNAIYENFCLPWYLKKLQKYKT